LSKTSLRGAALATAGTFLWALAGSVGQYLFETTSMTADWFVAVRMVIAGIILTVLGFVKDGKENLAVFREPEDRMKLFLFSILGMWFCQYTFYAAIAYSNSGMASVLQSLSRVLILAVLCIRLRRPPVRRELLAVWGAVAGTFLLGIPGGGEGMAVSGPGLTFGLLSAVGSYFYNTMPGHLMNKYGTYQTVGYGSLIGGMLFALISRPWTAAVDFSAGAFLVFLAVTVLGTIFAPAAYLKGIAALGPLKGSMIGNTQPLFAVLIAVLFLGTRFRLLDLAGFGLILFSITLLSADGDTEA